MYGFLIIFLGVNKVEKVLKRSYVFVRRLLELYYVLYELEDVVEVFEEI